MEITRTLVPKPLRDFFNVHPKAALAFSGGVDSTYLLYAARACAPEVRAYFVKTPFQPAFELEDARRVASEIGADLTVISFDILKVSAVVANPKDRCYHCKTAILNQIAARAREDGLSVLIDGTNASDDPEGRPGFRALRELGVLSPLRAAGLTKEEIRSLSKAAGLFTWDKPSYSCLATRIPSGMPITREQLEKTESAENYLFSQGFTNFRVRTLPDGSAAISIPEDQFPLLMDKKINVLCELKKYFDKIYLDLEARA